MVILFVFALPASSLIVKYCPSEKPDAAGNLMSNDAEALTPKILSVIEAVTFVVTFVLEYVIPPTTVTVTLLPIFDATTPAPTKSTDDKATVKLDPSSFMVIALAPPPPEEEASVMRVLAYFPI